MRNEAEFKSEIYERLKTVKQKKAKRKKILLTAIPLFFVVSIVGVSVLFGGKFTAKEENSADGAVNESVMIKPPSNNFKDYADTDDLGTVGNKEQINSPETESVSDEIIYTEKDKIDGFKALLGEFLEYSVLEGTASKATGTTVILKSRDKTEKYIVIPDAVFRDDMKSYCPLDENSYSLIKNYLNTTPEDK